MTTRAGVSESVFNDVFATEDQCYQATFEEGLVRLSRAVELAVPRDGSWLKQLRAGLVSVLGFLDDEPQWARLLVLEASIAGPVPLECQQRLLGVLTGLFDPRGSQTRPQPPVPQALIAELVAGGVLCVIRARILDGQSGTLVELAPSLMSFIAIQYGGPVMTGQQAQLDEYQRAQSIFRGAELPIRATRRTTLVLRAVAKAPYSNNREVARAAGLADEGQTSKLLARLQRRGVLENVGIGAARGEPNAWLLTASGQRALALIGASRASLPRGAGIAGEA